MMKVFVYNKKTNETVAKFTDVPAVECDDDYIYITKKTGIVRTFNRKKVKTRIYQN